jgi:hypothetical protein
MNSPDVNCVNKPKLLYFILLFFLFIRYSDASSYAYPKFYDLNVRIEPESGEVFVEGKLEIQLIDPLIEKFQFNLHGTFQIQELKINGHEAVYGKKKNKPWVIHPSSMTVSVVIPEDYRAKKISMEIVYSGKLEDIPEFGTYEGQKLSLDDQINSRMVELASYSCWYPLFTFGNKFDVDLKLSLPDGWNCVCSGEETESWREGKRAHSRWTSEKDTDFVIVASRDLKLKVFEGKNADIHFYSTQMPDHILNQEARQIEKIVNLYTNLLGKTTIPSGTVKHVFSPKQRGQGGAGFARPGLIVTSEGLTLESLKKDPDFSLFHGLAHEIAHFWWNFGSGQGDWINETFAEYFSSVADQKILSEKIFRDDLARYARLSDGLPEDAPSLSSVPFEDGKVNYIVRYYKGSLMLDSLRERVGDPDFFQICRDFYQTFHKELIGTAEFRSFWEKRLGKHKEMLVKWLDSHGGIRGIPSSDPFELYTRSF